MSNHVDAADVPTGTRARRNNRILERLKKYLTVRSRSISLPNGSGISFFKKTKNPKSCDFGFEV
jgi:hypothetical protein